MLTPFKYDLDRTPQQGRFVFSPKRFPAYFGGFNNGKTFGLCLRSWKALLEYPGNAGVLARSQVSELRRTTRREFFEIIGCNETTIANHPVVARWSGQENHLRLKNGSEIWFVHLQDEQALASLLSLNIRFFGIDQAEEVPEAAFLTLISRIGRTDVDSQTGKPLPPAWGAVVGNPKGHNWVWERWKRDADPRGLTGDYYHLEEATTLQGPMTSPEYVAVLKATYPERWYRRYVLGNWDEDSGRIYNEFDPEVHVIDPFEINPLWKAGVGVDLGYNHPTAFEWCAVDFNGNWYVYDEHVGREMTPNQHSPIVKAKGITRTDGSQLTIYAPHDAANRNPITGTNLQQAYADEGIYFLRGNQMQPVVRIMKIKQMLQVRPDVRNPFTGKMGCPRCFIFRNCPHLIKGMQTYSWKELKLGEEKTKAEPDDVIKVGDDECDAFGHWALGFTARQIPEQPRRETLMEQQIRQFMGSTIDEEILEDAEIN